MIKTIEKDGNLIFTVRVVPRASKSEIAGEFGGALKVKIKSPPVDGAANEELIKLLSKKFNVSKSEVKILSGQASKTKQISVSNVKSENLSLVLQPEN
jgi:uncharacterized protein (TIGR00251 family)